MNSDSVDLTERVGSDVVRDALRYRWLRERPPAKKGRMEGVYVVNWHDRSEGTILRLYELDGFVDRALGDTIESTRAKALAAEASERGYGAAQEPPVAGVRAEPLKLDTTEQVFFYEQEFYVLSNFSAFDLMWKGYLYSTSEAAYHSEKFAEKDLRVRIMHAASAHEAFKLAEAHRDRRRKDWDAVKVGVMLDILRAKAKQHEYVRRKLLETGERELVENSWRDDYWGWGPNRSGQNMLGKLWMQVRSELRAAAPQQEKTHGT